MGLFKKDKKKTESVSINPVKVANETAAKVASNLSQGLSVKILGSGCAKCNQLEAATKAALEQLGMDVAIDHVTDFTKIAAYGVMSTPAIVVNEKVVSMGKVLKTDEIVKLMQKIL
jgi:small redox-active disulfide protein 2